MKEGDAQRKSLEAESKKGGMPDDCTAEGCGPRKERPHIKNDCFQIACCNRRETVAFLFTLHTV